MEGSLIYLIIHIIITSCLFLALLLSGFYRENELISVFLVKRKYSLKGWYLIILGYTIYIIFSVFRTIDFDVGGIDAYMYKFFFNIATKVSFSAYNDFRKEEVGYNLMIWLIGRITDDFRVVLFIMHTVCYFSFAYFLKYTIIKKNLIFTYIYIFITLSWLFLTFNTLRYNFALSLSLIVFIELENENNTKAILFWILGLLFHKSLLILIPPMLFYVNKRRINKYGKKVMFLVIAMGIIVEFFFMILVYRFIASSEYSSYDNSDGIAMGTFFSFAFMIIITLIFRKSFNIKNSIDIKFVFICSSFLALPIQSYYSIAYRMVMLFMPISFKSFHNLIQESSSQKNGLLYLGVKMIVYIYFAYRCYATYFVEFVGAGLYPYKFGGFI